MKDRRRFCQSVTFVSITLNAGKSDGTRSPTLLLWTIVTVVYASIVDRTPLRLKLCFTIEISVQFSILTAKKFRFFCVPHVEIVPEPTYPEPKRDLSTLTVLDPKISPGSFFVAR